MQEKQEYRAKGEIIMFILYLLPFVVFAVLSALILKVVSKIVEKR